MTERFGWGKKRKTTARGSGLSSQARVDLVQTTLRHEDHCPGQGMSIVIGIIVWSNIVGRQLVLLDAEG